MSETPPFPADRVGHTLGSRPVRWRSVSGGYTAARRFVVQMESGVSAFVKAATDERTAGWLRAEHRVYSHLTGDFLPALLGWDDDGERPLLILEDLSGAHWPPPWMPGQVERVLEMLDHLHGRLADAPPDLPRLEDMREEFTGWRKVAADPEPFLSLGMCSRVWLENALPALLSAEAAVVLDGNDLLHFDVRSDNLCFIGEQRVLLVDWNWTCRGNGLIDVAGLLPSLHREGGPLPDTILLGQPEIAALLSGYWASRAGLPSPPELHRLRGIQRAQLEVALPWAVRALDLPPPLPPSG